MIRRIFLAVAVLSMTGCGVVYTSLQQEPDGSYILTGTHDNFFTFNGHVYRCSPDGDRMKCQLTSEN